jgi:hypothetical protein
VQWNEATKRYNDLRNYIRRLREKHPPRSRNERALLQGCRQRNQAFARELVKPRGKIRVELLNELSEAIVRAAVEYMNEKRK